MAAGPLQQTWQQLCSALCCQLTFTTEESYSHDGGLHESLVPPDQAHASRANDPDTSTWRSGQALDSQHHQQSCHQHSSPNWVGPVGIPTWPSVRTPHTAPLPNSWQQQARTSVPTSDVLRPSADSVWGSGSGLQKLSGSMSLTGLGFRKLSVVDSVGSGLGLQKVSIATEVELEEATAGPGLGVGHYQERPALSPLRLGRA